MPDSKPAIDGTIRLNLTAMANGGAAIGRDENKRVIFVPLGIPGEQVDVTITQDKGRYAHGRILEVVQPAEERITPRCPHFGPCGGCHFQHIRYADQLRFKEAIVADQLNRIGGFSQKLINPVIANPEPWEYSLDVSFSPGPNSSLGFWSPERGGVMAIERCYIIPPELQDLFQDVDLILPGLRQLTLRMGEDGLLLAALEIDGTEPPSLETDFPISVNLVLPDGTAANLVGHNHLIRHVKDYDFRISAGSFFYPSSPAAELLIDTVLTYAALQGTETVFEFYSGVGMLTAALAGQAKEIIGIESNPDSIDDASVNLNEFDNVTLYEGTMEAILPLLDRNPDVIVVDPGPSGFSPSTTDNIVAKLPARIIYISVDAATLARDGRRLANVGYNLDEVQPIDMYPQNYRTLTVSLWRRVSVKEKN